MDTVTWTTKNVMPYQDWVDHKIECRDPQEATRQRIRDRDRVTTLRSLSNSSLISRRTTHVLRSMRFRISFAQHQGDI